MVILLNYIENKIMFIILIIKTDHRLPCAENWVQNALVHSLAVTNP